jgi:hypothetical protein
MTVTKAAAAVTAVGFVLFIVEGVRERIDPLAAAQHGGVVASANAQVGACAAPGVAELSGNWVVRSVGCKDCKQTHLNAGDKLSFAQDVSGDTNFALSVRAPGSSKTSSTVGYALASDGVGNVTGPIVLSHSALDGTPLGLHYLIVKIRRYDVDGLGQCKLRARISVCDSEPARGAGACSAQQHGGEIHADPDV